MTVPIAGRGDQILAIYGLFTALTSVSLALRASCRLWIVKSFGWDDGLAVIAWVSLCLSHRCAAPCRVSNNFYKAFFVIHASFAICGVHHGTGQHAWDIKPASEIPVALKVCDVFGDTPRLTNRSKFWWLCEPIYVISNMAIKASICMQLLRVAPKPVKPPIRISVYVVLVVTEVFSAAFFFVFIFQCQPSAYFWTRYTGGSGTCIPPRIIVNVVYTYSAITCIGDWLLAILPCILVWDLQMKRNQKILVAIILAMGAV